MRFRPNQGGRAAGQARQPAARAQLFKIKLMLKIFSFWLSLSSDPLATALALKSVCTHLLTTLGRWRVTSQRSPMRVQLHHCWAGRPMSHSVFDLQRFGCSCMWLRAHTLSHVHSCTPKRATSTHSQIQTSCVKISQTFCVFGRQSKRVLDFQGYLHVLLTCRQKWKGWVVGCQAFGPTVLM